MLEYFFCAMSIHILSHLEKRLIFQFNRDIFSCSGLWFFILIRLMPTMTYDLCGNIITLYPSSAIRAATARASALFLNFPTLTL